MYWFNTKQNRKLNGNKRMNISFPQIADTSGKQEVSASWIHLVK